MRRIGLLGFGLSVLASAFLIFTPPAKAQIAELTYETAKEAFDTHLLNSLTAGIVSNELDIFHAYLNQRAFYQPIFPPMPDDLNQPAGLRVFDPAGFPAAFIKKLIPFECAPAITAYRVVIREMVASNGRRYRAIFNAAGEPLSWGWTAQTYDPLAFLKLQYPMLMTDWLALADDLRSPAAKLLQDTYEPRRFVMALDLLPKESLVDYVWSQSLSAEKLAAFSGEPEMQMMQMEWTGSTAYIEFVGLDLTNSAVWMTVGYPSNFTDRISFVACADLLQTNWVWLTTTNPPAYTNLLIVQDAGACTNRMFAAYNEDADTDGDGVADGREFYLDKTDPEDSDDPPNVSGDIYYSSYSGGQTGLIYVVAVTNADSWATNYSATAIVGSTVYSGATITTGHYHIVKIPANNYYVKAYRDSNGNKSNDTSEAYGDGYVDLEGQYTGKNISLGDPDNDWDNLPDWWENKYFGSITNYDDIGDPDHDKAGNFEECLKNTNPTNVPSGTNLIADADSDGMSDDWEIAHGLNPNSTNGNDGAVGDPDDDGFSNLEEYRWGPLGTDPGSWSDQPPNVRGNVAYEPYSGGQTGLIYVIAVTNEYSWTNTFSAMVTNAAENYFIKLPTNGAYWVKAYRDSNGNHQPDPREATDSVFLVYVDGPCDPTILLVDPDTDNNGQGDGLGDWWEIVYWPQGINYADPNGDDDVDHLINLFEYYEGTNPRDAVVADSDGDGMSDDWEYCYRPRWSGDSGLDINDPNDAPLDLDNDKVSNLNEFIHYTNPKELLYVHDSDGDGMSDDWEIQYGLNPTNDINQTDAGLDPDGDGYSNLEEYQAGPWGTDPNNPNDHPRTIRPGFLMLWTNRIMYSTWITCQLDFTNNYFGRTSSVVCVYDHGVANMTGEVDYAETGPEQAFWAPGKLETTDGAIAPFFSDIDTDAYPEGRVWYGLGTCGVHKAFAVTWQNVHASQTAERNWFQCVWIDRSDDVAPGAFDLEYNYEIMPWDSWYCPVDEFGSAIVGFGSSSGNGLEWPGSGFAGQLADDGPWAMSSNRLNSEIKGRYVFHFRNGMPYWFLFKDNMASNAGWTLGANWAFYGPTATASAGDPTNSFLSGTNIIGYKATGAYETNIITPRYATTPAIICTNTTNVYLHFRRWLNVSSGDVAKIEISTNNVTWSPVWSNATAVHDADWFPAMYDISTRAAGSTNVRVRWAMGPTDGVQVGDEGGWNIDEVRVLSFK